MTCRMPTGAFYAFPNIGGILGRRGQDGPIPSPQAFADHLLKHAHVAVVPGEPFGSKQHIRLSYATSMDAIQRGLDRIAAAVEKLTV